MQPKVMSLQWIVIPNIRISDFDSGTFVWFVVLYGWAFQWLNLKGVHLKGFGWPQLEALYQSIVHKWLLVCRLPETVTRRRDWLTRGLALTGLSLHFRGRVLLSSWTSSPYTSPHTSLKSSRLRKCRRVSAFVYGKTFRVSMNGFFIDLFSHY